MKSVYRTRLIVASVRVFVWGAALLGPATGAFGADPSAVTSPGMASGQQPATHARCVPGEVIVRLKDGQTLTDSQTGATAILRHQATLLRLEARHGVQGKGQVFRGMFRRSKSQTAVRGQDDLLRFHLLKTDRDVWALCDEMKNDPDVEYVQPNYMYTPCAIPNDPLFADQYAHQLTQMPEAWDISTGSPDVVVAVIGTGVDINHPDLKENIWVNQDELPGNGIDDDRNGYVDDRNGWNFGDRNGDVLPGSSSYAGHETAVAGVLAAVGNNGIGPCGVTWHSKTMPLRLSDSFSSAEVAGAIEYAAANGARVVNMSFGADEFGPEGDPVVKTAVDHAFDQGVLLVASAGNANTDRPMYPAAYYNVLAVAATNGEDLRARWGDGSAGSTFGLWVDLAAPGTDMPTLAVGGRYTTVDGTSASSPYVAGVAALLFSCRADLTNVEARAILENTTDPIDYGSIDPNLGYLGTGRVNAHRALQGVTTPYPMGEIVTPAERQEFAPDANLIPVVLSALGDSYRLEYQVYGADGWTVAGEGNVPSEAQDGLISLAMDNPGVGTYVLRLSVTRNGCTHTDKKAFGVPSGHERSNWPVSPSGQDPVYHEFMSSPLCLDINADGRNEVIQSLFLSSSTAYGIYTYVWDQDGNSLPGWPQELSEFASPLTSGVADIDGDGDAEVVTATMEGEVYAWHAENGRPLSDQWPIMVGGWVGVIESSPVLADLDGDGASEILAAIVEGGFYGGEEEGSLIALRGDGTQLWDRAYRVRGPLSVADLDHDGHVEIAFCGHAPATSNVYTYVVDHEGQVLKKWRGGSDIGTVIADLDADGKSEILFCTETGIKAVHLDGSILWEARVSGDFGSFGAISVGDLNGDGKREVFVNALLDSDSFEYTGVFAWDCRGRLLSDAGFPKAIMGYPLDSAPLVGDVDGDGERELVVGVAGEPLMAWKWDGTIVAGFPRLGVAAAEYVTPVLCDLDQDGAAEILVGGDDYRFHLVDLPVPYAADTVDWGMSRHDPQGSGWASRAPRLNPLSMPAEVRPGQRVQMPLTVSNPDDLPVRFHVGQVPEGARFDDKTSTIIWKPTANQVFETYTFHIVVTDGVRQDCQAISIAVVPDALYSTNMDTDPGWRLDAGWAWGTPKGMGSWKRDPTSGHTGLTVLGYALDGDYGDSVQETRYATTGPIACQGYRDIRLSFWRWLGVESPYDKANVQVSNDGKDWVDLWQAGLSHVSDAGWQFVEYAVPSSVADGQPTVSFRWGIGPTDDSVTYPGWNIDDVQVTGRRLE